MKIKTIIGATVVVLFSLFAIAGFSQRTVAQTSSTNGQNGTAYMGPNPESPRKGMTNSGMMHGPMMYGRMMNGSMGRNMMENHTAMQKLINRLESDLSSAKAEAGSSAIRNELADAGSAVTQLKQEYSQSWGMMQHMPMYANNCYGTQTQQTQK